MDSTKYKLVVFPNSPKIIFILKLECIKTSLVAGCLSFAMITRMFYFIMVLFSSLQREEKIPSKKMRTSRDQWVKPQQQTQQHNNQVVYCEHQDARHNNKGHFIMPSTEAMLTSVTCFCAPVFAMKL